MQETNAVYKSDLSSEQLEAAFPTLMEKLRELNKDLSAEDKSVFAAIINSATEHASFLDENNGSVDKLAYNKPIQAIATTGIRKMIMELPESIGVAKPSHVDIKH
jgi:hypothetical protein